MKTTILILLFTTSLFAVEKSIGNNDFEISKKQIEHQLSVQSDAAGAATKCLAELKNENLNKEQKQAIQQLLKRAAIQCEDMLIVREAEAYLTTQNIPCDKLKQRLSLGLPENLNTNLNKNIREALDYQWNNLKWQTDSSDYSVFDSYLAELTENTNITECARVQTALLRTIIFAWKSSADIIELDFKTVDKQYERLLLDLQCPKDRVKLIEVKKALDRLYETARKYMEQKHPYLALAAIINLSLYAKDTSKVEDLKDITRVQINKLYKLSDYKLSFIFSSSSSRRYMVPGLEKKLLIRCSADEDLINIGLGKVSFREWIKKGLSKIDIIKIDYTYVYNHFSFNSKKEKLPLDINSLISLRNEKNKKRKRDDIIFTNIVFQTEKLNWMKTRDNCSRAVITGKWNQAVWDKRFSKLENDILKLEPALNEIRKYVYDNYEKERIERKQHFLEKKKIASAFLNELQVFAEEGPKENEKAMKARGELVKLLEKYPGYGKQGFLDALRGYPEKTCNMPGFLSRLRGKINARFKLNSSQWIAWQYYGEVKNLESVIKKEKDPQLITKYFQTIIKKLDDEFPDDKYPGLQLAIKTANRNNITVIITNLIPYISSQLEEIAKGEEEKNMIINLADGIDSCVKSLKDKLIIDNYQIIQFNRINSIPWPANKQCEFARSTCNDICTYSNLNKQKKIKKIVDIYNVLVKTMRECSYFVTNRPNYVTFSMYADGLDKSIPLIYKCLSEINKKYYSFPQYSLSSFLSTKYRPDRKFWKERAQFDDLNVALTKYYYIYLSSEQQRKKLIIEKLMSFVRSVKADAGQSTNTVDWIVKFGLTNKFSKVEELDLPVDGYIVIDNNLRFGIRTRNLQITNITHGTPAYNAGLQVGDIFTSVNGNDVKSQYAVWGYRDAVNKQYVPFAYLGVRRGDKELLYKIVKDQPDKNELDKTVKTKTKSNKDVFNKEMKIFVEEGPKVNEKAMETRGKLLNMLSNSPDLASEEFVGALKKYPEVTKESVNILLDDQDDSNFLSWYALYLQNSIQSFQKIISSSQNSDLDIQFLNSFMNEQSRVFSYYRHDRFPALNAVIGYIRKSGKNISVTNFVPLLANELKRIVDGYSMPENVLLNYIQLLDEWIPVAVKAEQVGLKNAFQAIVNVNDRNFNWQAKARIELAKRNIISYRKLPERKRILKTVEALVELERGLREDAGLSTGKSPNPLYKRGSVDWVEKLGLDKPDIREFYEVKKICFPKRPLEFINASGQVLHFKIDGKSQFKKEGETIYQNKKELYKIGKVTFKKEEVYNKLINSTQYIDVSSVEIKDLQTGGEFILIIGKESFSKNAEATLLRKIDNKEIIVKKGDEVPLNKKKSAKITNINVQNQSVAFVTGSETNIMECRNVGILR